MRSAGGRTTQEHSAVRLANRYVSAIIERGLPATGRGPKVALREPRMRALLFGGTTVLIAALVAVAVVSSWVLVLPHSPPPPQPAHNDQADLPAPSRLVPGGVLVGPSPGPADAPPTLPPLLAAETAVPTEQDIGAALRPAPKGLAVHQGLPMLDVVSEQAVGGPLPHRQVAPASSSPSAVSPQPPIAPAPSPPEASAPTDAPKELMMMRTLKRQLEQLPKGKIYLNAPIEMKVSDKRTVDVRVGVNVSDDILRGHARAGDQRAEGTLPVSYEMIATLNGPGFAIVMITPEKQTVVEGYATVWEWEVEAKKEGAQELEATVYALVPDSASATARQRIDSYTQTINVLVKAQTWGEWLRSVSEEINAVKAIAIALGGIATAALGWLGISASRRSRSPTKPRKPRAPAAKSGGV